MSDFLTRTASDLASQAGALVPLIIYYPLGMLIYDRIGDDIGFQPLPAYSASAYSASGGSATVSMAASLAAREADRRIASLGFHLLRARTQIKELADTLRK
ncbi:MAG: hypothetical protein K1X51_07345 [Rhodospirillaceae bacterium]|nr:hypothetical protein [Rhodospirillaceae bacterium]